MPKIQSPALQRSAPSVEQAAHPVRVLELDGIRAIAILLVVFGHYFYAFEFRGKFLLQPFLNFGYSGVDLFFVLSGYLLTSIVLREKNRVDFLSSFFRRRFYRIVPLYYLFLAAAFALSHWVPAPADSAPWWVFLFHLQPFWFSLTNHQSTAYLNITWSLGIEEYFYLSLPFVAAAVTRRRGLALAGLGLVLLPVARIFFKAHGFECAADAVRFDGILWGGAIAVFMATPGLRHKIETSRWLVPAWWVLVAGCFWMQTNDYAFYAARPLFSVSAVYSWMNAFYGVSVLLLVSGRPLSIARHLLSATPLVAVGRVSYFIYLFHMIVLTVVNLLTPRICVYSSLVALLITLGLAVASWRLLESRWIALGRQPPPEKKFKTLVPWFSLS